MNTYLVCFLGCMFILHVSCSTKHYKRTILFIKVDTDLGENVFIRGGNTKCTKQVSNVPCAIPIQHRSVSATVQKSAAVIWSRGDNFLDWNGVEINQSSFNGVNAAGTPLTWTTSKHANGNPTVEHDGFGFSPYNTFGSGYWMLDVEMDCSKTDRDWFHFKAYITPTSSWEPNVDQTPSCGGDVGGTKPSTSNNHQAKCGRLNLFYYGSYGCVINYIHPQYQPKTVPCGIKHFPKTRIINGHPSVEGGWPWMVEILYQGNHGCGAVLISSKWVLTAGHCVRTAKTYGPWTAIVRTGETDRHSISGRERDYFVKRIIKHPLFDHAGVGYATNDHDIALLELVVPVDIHQYDVTPACFPSHFNLDRFTKEQCWIIGWGNTHGTGDRMKLQELKVNVSSNENCSSEYGSQVSVRQVCAGHGTKQVCQGDSGSPLSCKVNGRWYVVGLVSWGDDGCHGRSSVFTRVSAFKNWIEHETQIRLDNPLLVG